jgi:hypothetical protein
LKRLAAFQNPEFYKKQKMRLSASEGNGWSCPLLVALPLGPVRYKVDAKGQAPRPEVASRWSRSFSNTWSWTEDLKNRRLA